MGRKRNLLQANRVRRLQSKLNPPLHRWRNSAHAPCAAIWSAAASAARRRLGLGPAHPNRPRPFPLPPHPKCFFARPNSRHPNFGKPYACLGGVYLDFYGLKEQPFSITPNPRFLFYGTKHREALNHVLYGIRERKGFVQLTGEVGAGKSTICRSMLEQLGTSYETALLLNPILSVDQLVQAIAMEFGLEVQKMDRLETVAVLNEV